MVVPERALAWVVTLALAGCGSPPPATSPATSSPPKVASSGSPPATVAVSSTPATPSGRPCGGLDCLAFDTPRQAFEHALAGDPRVVAVGEAHAQKAGPAVESATRRFARELLPALAPRVKGVVVELLAPDRRCEQREAEAVAERTKPITEPQREANQNEFVALGFEARKLGMRAEPLIPTCEELRAILGAENDVGALLELIASVTAREAVAFLDQRPPEEALLIYGGLVHNDVTPSAERAAWSFGPRLAEHAKRSYVELDLIVPELVRNEPPWTSLPWFSQYDPARAGRETLLYRTGPASFVLIFPRSGATESPKATP